MDSGEYQGTTSEPTESDEKTVMKSSGEQAQQPAQVVSNGPQPGSDGSPLPKQDNSGQLLFGRYNVAKTIIESVTEFVERFVFLQSSSIYLLISAWIVSTFIYKEFDYVGYLFAYSPEPQSGKTTLLEVLDLLVHNSSGIQVSVTEANLFRTAKDGTQLLDEIDALSNKEYLRSVLNAGFKRGGLVTRSEKGKAGFKPTTFEVFCPRAMAGIGLRNLERTTLDRTFAISMVRQKDKEKRDRLRRRLIEKEVQQLRAEIVEWIKVHRDQVIRAYERSEFPYFSGLSNRSVDISEPLAAIVEVAYAGTERLAKARRMLVEAIQITRKEQHSGTSEHRLLRHLLELSKTEGPLVGNATELAAMCTNLSEPPAESAISSTLRRYEFTRKSVRKAGESSPKYRYFMTTKDLQDVVDRWAGNPDEVEETTVSYGDVVGVVGAQEL